jgi:Zn-dependent peptidase ImmA (M78 family)
LATAIGLTRTSITNIEKGRQKLLLHTALEEIEANRFAAELLMSESFLKKDLEGLKSIDFLDDEHISELAKKYDVSKQSLLIRLVTLGYISHTV